MLAANEKIQAFKWKWELWETIFHHELNTSQYLINSEEINDDINMQFFFYVIMKWSKI